WSPLLQNWLPDSNRTCITCPKGAVAARIIGDSSSFERSAAKLLRLKSEMSKNSSSVVMRTSEHAADRERPLVPIGCSPGSLLLSGSIPGLSSGRFLTLFISILDEIGSQDFLQNRALLIG